MAERTGKQTTTFSRPISLIGWGSAVTGKEADGPLGKCFDVVSRDMMMGQDTFEKAESRLQVSAAQKAAEKSGISFSDLNFLFSGDLLNQCIASAYFGRGTGTPYFGLYGACSTMAEGLILASFAAESGAAEKAMVCVSSHFAASERQFRFPLEYGGQRSPNAQWTVTGAGAAVISGVEQNPAAYPKIAAAAAGKICDLGVKEIDNMGAAMAPAAADTLAAFLQDTGAKPDDFDLIVTGDLGHIGSELFHELLARGNINARKNHFDCGKNIYDRERQDVHGGGSGCGCCASVLCGHLLPKLQSGEMKNILFMATGALMSPVSVQQKETIPAVAHLVQIVK